MRALPLALAAALLALAGPAAAQDLASARAFVQGLYGAYGHGHPDYAGRDARRVFSPALVKLMADDVARTPKGDAPTLDGDPICDCQDASGLKLESLTVDAAGTPGRARAVAHVKYPDGRRVITLDLAAANGAWRVADIHTADMPSLVKLLRDSAPK